MLALVSAVSEKLLYGFNTYTRTTTAAAQVINLLTASLKIISSHFKVIYAYSNYQNTTQKWFGKKGDLTKEKTQDIKQLLMCLLHARNSRL